MITAKPVRLVPFDLGSSIDSATEDRIIKYLDDTTGIVRRDPKFRSLNPQCFVSSRIESDCCLDLFETGIAVFTIFDGEMTFEDPDHFSIEYNESRRLNHNLLFSWTHSKSDKMKQTLIALRNIVKSGCKHLRESASFDYETNGMSYIMTVSFFDYSNPSGLYKYDEYPHPIKNNILALLDPSLLYLEESGQSKLSTGSDLEKNRRVIDNLDATPLIDYDSRRNLSAHMSWSAVVIIGELNETNITDYVFAEINLQHEWFLVHCIVGSTPSSADDSEKRKMRIQDIQTAIADLDMVSDRLYASNHSNLPTRFMRINRGLIETSGIESVIERESRRLGHIMESLNLENMERQRRYASGSELLLLIIAVLQIFPILYDYTEPPHQWIGILIMVLAIAMGAILLFRKNRVMTI